MKTLTPDRLDEIEAWAKAAESGPWNEDFPVMAAEIRRCWAEKDWLLKKLSEIGCPATVYDIRCHRIFSVDCEDYDDECWRQEMEKAVG